MAFISGFAGSAVREKPPIVIHVANPSAFAGEGSMIVLEFSDEEPAIKLAEKLARETGRCVTVRDADMTLIAVIPAASTH